MKHSFPTEDFINSLFDEEVPPELMDIGKSLIDAFELDYPFTADMHPSTVHKYILSIGRIVSNYAFEIVFWERKYLKIETKTLADMLVQVVAYEDLGRSSRDILLDACADQAGMGQSVIDTLWGQVSESIKNSIFRAKNGLHHFNTWSGNLVFECSPGKTYVLVFYRMDPNETLVLQEMALSLARTIYHRKEVELKHHPALTLPTGSEVDQIILEEVRRWSKDKEVQVKSQLMDFNATTLFTLVEEGNIYTNYLQNLQALED